MTGLRRPSRLGRRRGHVRHHPWRCDCAPGPSVPAAGPVWCGGRPPSPARASAPLRSRSLRPGCAVLARPPRLRAIAGQTLRAATLLRPRRSATRCGRWCRKAATRQGRGEPSPPAPHAARCGVARKVSPWHAPGRGCACRCSTGGPPDRGTHRNGRRPRRLRGQARSSPPPQAHACGARRGSRPSRSTSGCWPRPPPRAEP